MSRILFFLVALIAVAIAVLLFLPGLIPVAPFKDRIETAASSAMGREVTISDNLSFRIFPRTAFHVEELQIANADGFDEPYLIRVEEADIGVKLLPLLSESVEIDRFVLTRPDIRLARKRNGEINWNLASTDETSTHEAASETQTASSRDLRELKLGDVRIVDGAMRFVDDVAGKTYVGDAINLAVVLKSLAEPLEAKGDLIFQGEATTIDMVLTSLSNIMRDEPGNLKLNMKIGETTAGADVTVSTKDGISYSGPVTFNAPDLPAFAALAGTELAQAPGFDNLSVKGDVNGTAEGLRLEKATINLDQINAQGAMNLSWSGAKPKADGVLSTDKLDLRPYMPAPTEGSDGFPAWSEVAMDFSSLRNMDADFDISTNAIFVNDLELGESRIKLTIANGRMTAEIPELSMYGGQGSGRMVVNARGATPSFAGNFDVDTVSAQPLTLDLMKHDNLLGIGGFKFNFTASGASQAAIMRTMDGSGGFDLANGALKGVNIAGLVRAIGEFQTGFNPAALQRAVAEARGPTQETEFSEFLSNFTITNGLVNAPTINMIGPYLTMTGRGNINLAEQTIDLRLLPKGSQRIDGEGGRTVSVPVRVGGTFAKPTIGVDAESLLQSGFQRTLQNVLSGSDNQEEGEDGEAAEEDPAGALLRGILGGGRQEPDENQESAPSESETANPKEEASAEEVLLNQGLNALFGRTKKSEEAEEAPQQ